MVQCQGGRHAHPPYVHETLRPNDRTDHVYNDTIGLNELVLEHYPISPVNDDVLSASASPNYVTYATYANNFITPSIVTTMTSLVFYFYEFNEQSTNLSMSLAFTIMAAACILRLLVARIQITEMPRCIDCAKKRRDKRHTALRVEFLQHEARQVVREIPDAWLHDFMPLPHNVWLHDFTPLPHNDLTKSTAG